MPCKCCLSKKHFLVFQARGLRSQSADAGVTANMEKIQVYIILYFIITNLILTLCGSAEKRRLKYISHRISLAFSPHFPSYFPKAIFFC